jgi:hypothetical protein
VRFDTLVFCDITPCEVRSEGREDKALTSLSVFNGRDSNQTPPKYKSVAFSIKKISRSH